MNRNLDISLDRLFTVSAIAGMLAAVVKIIITGLFFYFELTERFGLQDAGTIIFRTTEMPLDIFHLILAALA